MMRCGLPVFHTMLQMPATMMSRPEHIPPMLKPRPNFSDLRGAFYGRLPESGTQSSSRARLVRLGATRLAFSRRRFRADGSACPRDARG